MKVRSFLFAGLLIFAVGTTALAQTSFTFKDVEDETWYSSAVYDFYQKGILTGFSDGTFQPNKAVTRAELATTLSRLSGYFEHPEGLGEWKIYSNKASQYSVAYPSTWTLVDPQRNQDRFTVVGPDGETNWNIDVYDASKISKEELLYGKDAGISLENSRTFEDEFVINQLPATYFLQTQAHTPDAYQEKVMIEAAGKIFVLSNGSGKNVDFEHFYRSFLVLR